MDGNIMACRAAAYTKIGKYKEAISDCYEAIRLEPRQALAYYRLGCAFYEQGNTLPAIRHGFLKGTYNMCLCVHSFLFYSELGYPRCTSVEKFIELLISI